MHFMIIRSRAPLRISFGGGGTDVSPYPETQGGVVISTTIDRYAYVIIKENQDGVLRIISQDYNLLEIFNDISDLQKNSKLGLVKAAFNHMNIKKQNITSILHVDSPPGSGLGSSSALTVALIGAINQLQNKSSDSYEVAKLAYDIERHQVGIKGGMQDQYAAAFGGFNLIEFGKDSVKVKPLKLHDKVKNELLASMVLINTGKTRISAKILEQQIKSYQEKNEKTIKILDSIKQMAYDIKNLLIKGNIEELAKLIHESWMLKKNLVPEISNPEIDKIYSTAMSAGAMGGKLLGAGGGGHMLFFCDLENRVNLEKELQKLDCDIVKFNFDESGLKTWCLDNKEVRI